MNKITLVKALAYDHQRKQHQKEQRKREFLHAVFVSLFTASVTLSILWGIVYA